MSVLPTYPQLQNAVHERRDDEGEWERLEAERDELEYAHEQLSDEVAELRLDNADYRLQQEELERQLRDVRQKNAEMNRQLRDPADGTFLRERAFQSGRGEREITMWLEHAHLPVDSIQEELASLGRC